MQTMHTRIEGRVQGVFFRESTRKEAVRLGLKGWVKNMNDGAVEAVFQGEEESLAKMQAWLKEGPPQAKVTDVTVDRLDETKAYDTFQVVF